MLVEGIFKDVQLHGLVEVLEEDFPQVVAFADDDGILRIQIVEAGKSGTEHRMRRHVAEAAFIVEFLQSAHPLTSGEHPPGTEEPAGNHQQ